MAGARDSASIRIMPTPVWVLSWERRQESSYISVCATNIVPLVLKASPVIGTNASSTGQLHLSKWRQIHMLLEGFLEAEWVHGVRYMKFIGDGDSSVYPTLLQNVPGWGHAIKKFKCANNACKCYKGARENLGPDNQSYKGSGGITLKMQKRLVSSARAAIRMRSREN